MFYLPISSLIPILGPAAWVDSENSNSVTGFHSRKKLHMAKVYISLLSSSSSQN
jgi:hypothetical protein